MRIDLILALTVLLVSPLPAMATGGCVVLCQADFNQTATAEAVLQLVADGVDVNAKDAAGKSALHWAAVADKDTLRALIAAGADVNAEGSLSREPIHFYCWLS